MRHQGKPTGGHQALGPPGGAPLNRERARVGSQISFALSLAGVSFFKPVAASAVCDCAPSQRMRRQ